MYRVRTGWLKLHGSYYGKSDNTSMLCRDVLWDLFDIINATQINVVFAKSAFKHAHPIEFECKRGQLTGSWRALEAIKIGVFQGWHGVVLLRALRELITISFTLPSTGTLTLYMSVEYREI